MWIYNCFLFRGITKMPPQQNFTGWHNFISRRLALHISHGTQKFKIKLWSLNGRPMSLLSTYSKLNCMQSANQFYLMSITDFHTMRILNGLLKKVGTFQMKSITGFTSTFRTGVTWSKVQGIASEQNTINSSIIQRSVINPTLCYTFLRSPPKTSL